MKAGIRNILAAMLVALSLLAAPATSAMASPSEFKVMPNHVDISGTFRGAVLEVQATVPKGAQAVVEITGAAHEERLLKKGRRGGLWMSVGEVKIKGAPKVYLMLTTPGDVLSHDGAKACWGYAAIERGLEFSGAVDKGHEESLFREFVKLKESNGLYGVFPGALKASPESGDMERLAGNVKLPGNIAAGKYKVVLSVIGPDKQASQQITELVVEMKGLPALLDSLAHHHAVTYGLLSVFIALVTGLVMGFVFKSKSAH